MADEIRDNRSGEAEAGTAPVGGHTSRTRRITIQFDADDVTNIDALEKLFASRSMAARHWDEMQMRQLAESRRRDWLSQIEADNASQQVGRATNVDAGGPQNADVPEVRTDRVYQISNSVEQMSRLLTWLESPADREGKLGDILQRVRRLQARGMPESEIRWDLYMTLCESVIAAIGRLALKATKWAGLLAATEIVKQLAKRIIGQ